MFLCRDEYEMVLFRAASLLTFSGTLRISEVTASGKNDKARAVLQWQDVRVEDRMVQILI